MSAAILDVARHCHLSPGIVNRVLSACQADISDETRSSVLAAARELGCEASPPDTQSGRAVYG